MILQALNILFILLIIVIFLFLAINENRFNNKTKQRVILFTILLLAIFAGFREIGTDLVSYINIFNNRHEIIQDYGEYFQNIFMYRLEPAFMILMSLIKQAGLGFKFFLFLSALLPMLLLYRIIIKVEKTYLFTIFLLFLLMYFIRGPLDIIRHFFAAVIYLSALYSLSNNSNSIYYLKSSISFFFHYSNIATLILKPFLHVKWNISQYLLVFVITFLLGFSLQSFVESNINNLVFNSSVFLKFQNYLVDDYHYNSNAHLIFRNLLENTPVIFNIFLCILALKYKEIIYKNKFNGLLLNSMIIGTILYSFMYGMGAYTMAFRINFLFGIGSIFIVKELFINYHKAKRSIVFGLIIVFLFFYTFIVSVYYIGIFKLL